MDRPLTLWAVTSHFGWWSLVPPLVSIVLAIVTRRVIGSLLAGVVTGALILARGNPLVAIPELLETHLWGNLVDADHLRVFGFTLIMGAMVSVIHATGGMRGLVAAISPWAKSRRGGQLIGWLLGMIIFFDDYANCLLLGNTLRPLTDRLRMSREKLAFIVDSTAAPVSGLAVVSTWVATEIGLIETGYRSVLPEGAPLDAMGVFVATIPYRFYVVWMLVFVPLVALLNREFGPMWRAEQAAFDGRTLVRHPSAVGDENRSTGSRERHWLYAMAPVLMMLVVTAWLLIATGAQALGEDPWNIARWASQFSRGNSYLSLVYGSLAGLGMVGVMALGRRVLTVDEFRGSAFDGAKHVLPALAILWLAWCLSKMTRDEYLGTGAFLGQILGDHVSPVAMPTIVFLIAAVISFATGTSWGTMGIVMPIVIPVTYRMVASRHGGSVDPYDPLLVASIGSVLAGAIFGDHCSPISDTTVLSSQSSSCDHLAHVWTQLPYSLTVAVISVICGTLPAAFGASGMWLFPVGVAVMIGLLLIVGRRVR